MFVHRDARNIHIQSQRDALRTAMQKRATRQKSCNTQTTTRTVVSTLTPPKEQLQRLVPETEIALFLANGPLTSKPAEFFYSTILEVFRPRAENGVFSGDRLDTDPADGNFSSLATCIRAMLPHANPAAKLLLDMALFSLLTMYMGRLANDLSMISMACSAYTSTIRDFQQIIGSSLRTGLYTVQAEHGQTFLALSTVLQLYEFTYELGKTGPGFLAHHEGMLHMLQSAGPEVYQSRALRQSFAGLRGIAVFVALERRQNTFLSRSEWKHIPFCHRPKTRRELLHDIALQLPALQKWTDQLVSSFAVATIPEPYTTFELDCVRNLDMAVNLFDNLVTVKNELECWLQRFKDHYAPKPLYWQPDDVLDNTCALIDPQCLPDHKDPRNVLRFQDGQKAGALICYWAIKLEVLACLIDLQDALSTIVSPDSSTAIRIISLCQDSKNYQAEADDTASLVLQTLPYLECCLEGVFVAQTPTRLAQKYLTRRRRRGHDQCTP